LSIAIITLTVIAAIATVLTTVLTAGVAEDARSYLDGEMSDDDFRNAIGPVNAAQLITGIATIAVFVFTVIWMYRIATNVRAFQRDTLWSPLFAIFGWMLPPFVLYVIPFLVLRELWKASDPTDVNDTDGWRRSADNPFIWAWLVLYGIVPIFLLVFSVGSFLDGGLASGSLESLADSLDEFDAFGVVTAVVNVAAAVVWIVLVRQLTARHVRLTSER
jgi:Domain of unknown function (DUF4328)